MSLTGANSTLTMIVVLGLFLVVSCTAGRSQDLDLDQIDATALLEDAAKRTDLVRSFHFFLEHEGGDTQIVRGLNMTRAEGDVVGKDKFYVEVEASIGPLNLRVQIVVIDDDAWITNPLTGRWESEDISISEVFDPATGVTAIMRAAKGARVTGTEYVNNTLTYQVDATVDSGDVKLFGEAPSGQTLVARAWIGVDDPLVHRIEVVGDLNTRESEDLMRTLTLSRFDADLEISPPQ